jgi:hypothetical protein
MLDFEVDSGRLKAELGFKLSTRQSGQLEPEAEGAEWVTITDVEANHMPQQYWPCLHCWPMVGASSYMCTCRAKTKHGK